MTGYDALDNHPRFNPERAEEGRRLLAAALPTSKGDPAVRYLGEQRGLPEAIVLAAPDLLYLPASACGRGPGEHSLISALRVEPGGDITGIQITWITINGEPAPTSDTARKRDYYAFVEGGCRDACWWAGEAGDEIHAAEGFCEKPAGLIAAGVRGRIVGFGSRSWLKHKTLAGKKLTIVADRAPGEQELTADGSLAQPAHERDYAGNVDFWLLNGFPDRVWLTRDPACCARCKDADDVWRAHQAKGVLAWLKRVVQGELGRQGWITSLARISDELERQAAIKAAVTDALYRGEPLFRGVPIKLIRQHVAAERERLCPKKAEQNPNDAEPWAEPVSDLAAVLDALVNEFTRYIAAAPAIFFDAAALFVAMTYVHERLHCLPKLAIQSPTKQCGKTTLLDCLASVVRRPELTSGVSEASFIRVSDAWSPTWCMDEADRYLNPANAGEALTAAINASSYRRFARKKVCVPSPNGGWDIHDFEFWCPMIMAGIKALVDTVQDRSIVLVMQRAKPGELKHRLVDGTSPVFDEVARKLTRWAQDLIELNLDPEIPAFLHNREADLWRPLFAIAVLASGTWPERVRKAALTIHGQRAEDEVRLTLLLEAIREEFGTSEQMFAQDLVAKLIAREGEPWATIKRNGAPLDVYYLRGILKGVIEREPTQREKGRGRRYYTRANFEEAWARYTSSTPENDLAHLAHLAQRAETQDPEPASASPDQNGASGASGAPEQPHLNDAPDAPDGAISSGATQDIDPEGENGAAPDAPDQIRPDASIYADAECGFWRAKLNGTAGVMYGGLVFHAEACLAEYLKQRPA